MPVNPEDTYVHLAVDGTAQKTPGGAEFWLLPPDEMRKFGQGWLISEFICTQDWPNWEMHPNADEFVYLLSGSAEVLLDEPAGLRKLVLHGSGAVVVPRGIWHTAKVTEPCRMLHVTRGDGTELRPA